MDENRVEEPSGPAASGDETPLPPVAGLIRGLVEGMAARVLFAWGVVILAGAIACLSISWKEISGEKASILERMTGRGTVWLLDSAVQIAPQTGPDMKMDPGRVLWHHDYRFEYVLELRYLPDHRVRVYRTAPSPDLLDAGFWPALEKEPRFLTRQLTVKMDKGLLELMKKTPAQAGVSFSVIDAPENAPREARSYWGTQFDQFWVAFDRPMHALALEWLATPGGLGIPVRYDPAAPDQFLLEKTYEAATETTSRTWSIVIGVLLGGLGLFILFLAVSMLTATWPGINRYVPLAVYCGIVLAVPFGSRYLQSAVDYLGLPGVEKSIIEELSHSMDPRVRAGFLEEVSAADQSALTALRVDVAHSRYRDLFAFFHLSKGGRRFYAFDEAMQGISAQLAEQLASMPARDQFRFFKLLDAHMSQREEGWDEPFLEGVRTLALDGTRSPNLRSWAISAFCDMCSARKDAEMAEFIYRQYVEGDEAVRNYWRNSFFEYVRAPSFAADLRSQDPARIRRALDIWADDHHFLEDVQFLAPRLKQLTSHSDPAIRAMAVKKWKSRTDWEDHP